MTETTILTHQESFDIAVCKTEIVDIDNLQYLLKTDLISNDEKKALSKYHKRRVNGRYVDITYVLGVKAKTEFVGRFSPKGGVGMQCFSRDIRAFLTQANYWDIDMKNAQPNLLLQYAEKIGLECSNLKKYCSTREDVLTETMTILMCNRDEAKQRYISLFFGGSNVDDLPDWVRFGLYPELCKIKNNIYNSHLTIAKKLKNNPNSVMAYMLQSIERDCLMCLDKALTQKGRNFDVLIHDGGLVRKLENEKEFPLELLKHAEWYIHNQTGYKVELVNKPIKSSFVIDTAVSNAIEISSSIVIDDSFAAKKFAELMGEHIILDSGSVWVFDNGLWNNEEAYIQKVITNCGSNLIFSQNDKMYNYSGIVKNTKNLMIKLPDILPANNGWFQERIHSDIGKLLFPNGIYDFKTQTFTTEFDSNIVFTGVMPRPFPIKNQEIVDRIRRISFDEAFAEDDHRETMLHSLMRAFIGDTLRKKFVIGTGHPNSGKGMIATLLHSCMGMLCSDFNGNSLLYKSGNGESSREYGWMKANVKSRISIGSEIMMREKDKTPAIDGVLLKTISSGVDPIKMRGIYERDSSFVNKSTFFLFAQDIPNINPPDKAVQSRIIPVEWSYSYVDNPTLSFERKADYQLAKFYSENSAGDAFFWLMVEEYEKWRNNNFKEPVLSEVILNNRDDFVPSIDYAGILNDAGYVVTRSEEDFVTFNELYPLFNGTKTAVGRGLGGVLGVTKKYKKIDKKAVMVYFGLKRR